jgi:hypothetical protein
MSRKRRDFVPEGGVECLEVRVVLYFDEDGDECIAYEIADLNGSGKPSLHTVFGVMEEAKIFMAAKYMENSE